MKPLTYFIILSKTYCKYFAKHILQEPMTEGYILVRVLEKKNLQSIHTHMCSNIYMCVCVCSLYISIEFIIMTYRLWFS